MSGPSPDRWLARLGKEALGLTAGYQYRHARLKVDVGTKAPFPTPDPRTFPSKSVNPVESPTRSRRTPGNCGG